MATSILRPVQPLTPLMGDGHGLPLTAITRASFMGRLPAQPGTEAILSATHTIGVAQRAPRRSLRSSHLAELAGRSCPHRWARSGLLHPGGRRRKFRHRCHLIVTSTRTSTRKNVELRGFEPLTFCMPYRGDSSPDRAGRRPAWRLPAVTMAGCGLMLPGACRCWLPTWLPGNSLARQRPAGRTGLPARRRPPKPVAMISPGHLRAPGPTPARLREPREHPRPRSVDTLLRY
jgi:hypothetical protein